MLTRRDLSHGVGGARGSFMWSSDGVAFADSDLIELVRGERIRLTMVDDTMMNHPMHRRGMWMESNE